MALSLVRLITRPSGDLHPARITSAGAKRKPMVRTVSNWTGSSAIHSSSPASGLRTAGSTYLCGASSRQQQRLACSKVQDWLGPRAGFFHEIRRAPPGTIDDIERLAGSLPNRQERLVIAWAEIHQEELRIAWDRLQQGRLPEKISPLT